MYDGPWSQVQLHKGKRTVTRLWVQRNQMCTKLSGTSRYNVIWHSWRVPPYTNICNFLQSCWVWIYMQNRSLTTWPWGWGVETVMSSAKTCQDWYRKEKYCVSDRLWFQDKTKTNLRLTGLPVPWTEAFNQQTRMLYVSSTENSSRYKPDNNALRQLDRKQQLI